MADRHQIKPYPLRMPDELRERLDEAAKTIGRSLHAEIVARLAASFSDRAGVELDDYELLSIGLEDPADRTAALKVLLLNELMLLRRRVADLGGVSAVLQAEKSDLVKRITGPKIQGTGGERKSYFSQFFGTQPLTAILTDEELEKIAERFVVLQDGIKTPKNKPTL